MPRDHSRTLRIAEQIQRELAGLIRLELKDPRVGMVTLTDVEVTADYAHAKVFFTTLGTSDQIAAATAGLNHAAGFLRHELGQRIKLRSIPQLHFIYDESVERGVRLSRLIDEAVAPAARERNKGS
ncbi:MAG: 30S ribosome-binding factor RbfA [Betaproteobacteria bacterium]|nr:30S ribosome-binding factor RbfA [Betaproteobacteria bacterium]